MNDRESGIMNAIEAWLRENQFTFYPVDFDSGKTIVVKFSQLEGYPLEEDISLESDDSYYEVSAILTAAVPESKRDEITRLLNSIQENHSEVETALADDGNISIVWKQMIREEDLNRKTIESSFYKPFGIIRDLAPSVGKILRDGNSAEEALRKREDEKKREGWDVDLPYGMEDYPNRQF